MIKLLLVDDNVEALMTAKTYFEATKKYEVLTAQDGSSALDLVKENRDLQVIFTDFVMPGRVRSVDMAREAKKLIENVHVIFASGYDVIDRDMIGDADIMPKPYNMGNVHKLIMSRIDKN